MKKDFQWILFYSLVSLQGIAFVGAVVTFFTMDTSSKTRVPIEVGTPAVNE